MKSTEMNVRDVQIKIAEMMDPEQIRSFITGDERKTVIFTAQMPRNLRNIKSLLTHDIIFDIITYGQA